MKYAVNREKKNICTEKHERNEGEGKMKMKNEKNQIYAFNQGNRKNTMRKYWERGQVKIRENEEK